MNLIKPKDADTLRIDTLAIPGYDGLLGLTLCPGKYQLNALSRARWDRDLYADLEAIRSWGAVSVITLNEQFELEELRVKNLGEEVTKMGMAWVHLPIQDQLAPDEGFIQNWTKYSLLLHRSLSRGEKTLIHCKGGLGRTGTVAAMVLIERGVSWQVAVDQVRVTRPGSIETRTQECFLREYANEMTQEMPFV